MTSFFATLESALLSYSVPSSLKDVAKNPTAIGETLERMVVNLIEGRYVDTLSLNLVNQTMTTLELNAKLPFDFTEALEDFIEDGLAEFESTEKERQAFVFFLGVNYLSLFLQANWTGPELDVPAIFEKYTGEQVLSDLDSDGEDAYILIKIPHYLHAARAILIELVDSFTSFLSSSIWIARTAFAHQRILSGPSDTLRKIIDSAFEKSLFAYPAESNRMIAAKLQLELSSIMHYYRNVRDSQLNAFKAKEITGLHVQLSGAMGKRTKYQDFDLAQLVLLANSEDSQDEIGDVPRTVDNPDETAPSLDHVKFKDAIPASEGNLTVLDQCILLALCLDVKNRNPRSGLTTEEMMVYVKRVLKNPNNWMVHSFALLLQSRLEFEKYKTMDKATLQIQVLVDQYNSDLEKKYDVSIRMKYLHQLHFPPQHELKRELGKKWLQIGSAASALQLFEQLEMWENVIDCYIIQERHKHAEELLRERIAIKPTPQMYGLLGDLTRDTTHYETAWEFSKHRFTYAKRKLGQMAMEAGNVKEAIAHYQDALRVNPQYASAWFRVGCCAIAINDLAVAQQAFSRCVQLTPDDGEAWNNLASVFLNVKKKAEAFRAFKEALKHKHNSWKIWENYLVLAMDLAEYYDALLAMDNILELREQHVDTEILSLLVKVIGDLYNNNKDGGTPLLAKTLDDFLKKVTTKVSNNPELWDLYSNYWERLGDLQQSALYRQKQCRSLQISGWESSLPQLQKLVDACTAMTEIQLKLNNEKNKYSAQLFLNSVIKKSLDSFEGTIQVEKLRDLAAQLS